MRHLVRGRKLGRTHAHRKATLQALAIALIREHRIQTTVPKAKELRSYIEPLITRAKSDTMHNRREVFSALQNKLAVKALFEEIAPQVGDRPGGYTRVLKTGFRSGDAAEMALIELVDFNLADADGDAGDKKKRTRRSRSGKGAASAASETAKATKPSKTEESVAEEVAEAEVVEESAEVNVSAEETATEQEAPAAETTSEASSESESEKKEDSDSDNEEEKA
jgi:large subunit ribosomal protein L17